MRLVANSFYDGWFYRTVNFYLRKSVLFITVNRFYGFFLRVCLDNTQRHWPLAINNTCFQDIWPNAPATIYSTFYSVNIFKFVAAVSNRCYTGRQVGRPPLRL